MYVHEIKAMSDTKFKLWMLAQLFSAGYISPYAWERYNELVKAGRASLTSR